MKSNKIDIKLFEKIVALGKEQQADCLVRAKNESAYNKYITRFGKRVKEKFSFINSFSIALLPKEISTLAKSDSVVYICSTTQVSALMYVAKQVMHIPPLLYGEGQTICFIDTGIKEHCDFMLGENRIAKFVDFVGESESPYDDNGHGTFVAGVCCGGGNLSGGKFSGVAPRAKIISLKALDKKGEANSNKILQAMQWISENKDQYKIDTVCMSFGSEPLGLNDPIMIGAEKLWDSGVTVVAAAGNSGPEYQTIKSPGVSRKIITVGGFDDNRNEDDFNPNFFEMASFSSRGPCFRYFKPDVIAPAVDIISCGKEKDYTCLSGTSVASPMIAGICALIKEKEKNFSPNQIKSVLLSICKPAFFNRNLEGFGIPCVDRIFK